MSLSLGSRPALIMAGLGFASGLPLMLTITTLRQYLVELATPVEVIGLTANIGLAYTFKFLWSPLLDHARPPLGLARFGRRRGWMLAVQPVLVLAILALSVSTAAWQAMAAGALIALSSATQDIAIDAWRIESFDADDQGLATAIYVWGYRIAMLAASGGVLWLAGRVGWAASLGLIALLAACAPLVTLAAREPALPHNRHVVTGGAWERVRAAVVAPLREFLARPGGALVLVFVLLFNLGENTAGIMLTPLYRHLGFSRDIVAGTSVFSLFGTLGGIALGGAVVARIGLRRALVATGFAQTFAMGFYVWLAGSPGRVDILDATVLIEAVVQGVATASFLAYLSSLCAAEFTATQYALLTSLAVVAAHTLGGFSGFAVEALGFQGFYTLAMGAAFPAMAAMLILLRRFPEAGAAKGN
jgi:MFS transporter, PAT family, beta-lactamase induction signal transducer AmpG